MGGSSAINYVVYMRGNKKDYDQWAALGNEGWSYREVSKTLGTGSFKTYKRYLNA